MSKCQFSVSVNGAILKQGHCRCSSEDEVIRVGLNPVGLCPYEKKEFGHRDLHTRTGRILREDEGRTQGGASMSGRMPDRQQTLGSQERSAEQILPEKQPTLPTPGLQTCSLQNCETIISVVTSFYYLISAALGNEYGVLRKTDKSTNMWSKGMNIFKVLDIFCQAAMFLNF